MSNKTKGWLAPTLLVALVVSVYAIGQQMGTGQQVHDQCQMSSHGSGATAGLASHAAPSDGESTNAPDVSISESTMLRCRMIMGMEVAATDPSSVLALTTPLDLTEQQVQAIQDVQAKARKQTQDLLTEAQQARLATIADSPAGTVRVHKAVMETMKAMHGGALKTRASADEPAGHGQSGKTSCCPADHATAPQSAKEGGQHAEGACEHEWKP